jgi:hypothetical protein
MVYLVLGHGMIDALLDTLPERAAVVLNNQHNLRTLPCGGRGMFIRRRQQKFNRYSRSTRQLAADDLSIFEA